MNKNTAIAFIGVIFSGLACIAMLLVSSLDLSYIESNIRLIKMLTPVIFILLFFAIGIAASKGK